MIETLPGTEKLPWHTDQWQAIAQQYAQDRIPHALLLTGPSGLGQSFFARTLARSWLCRERREDGIPCGHCRDCLLAQAGTHPDAVMLEPEDGKKEIGVQATRELIHRLHLTGNTGRRVTVIDPADQMNRASANAFLKTLEEPSEDVLLILVASRPHRLPVTVISRCQRMVFKAPDEKTAHEWLMEQSHEHKDEIDEALQLAGGAPLKALELLTQEARERRKYLIDSLQSLKAGKSDPQILAAEWTKQPLGELLETLARWLAMAAQKPGGGRSPLAVLLPDSEREAIFALFTAVNETRAALDTQLRVDLMIAALLIQWVELTSSTTIEG